MNFGAIFHSIRQGILVCDRHGRIIYFNEAFWPDTKRTCPPL